MRAFAKLSAIALAVVLVAVVFSLAVSPASGDRSAGTVAPSFARPYTVTFTETGLPSGTNWSVHIAFLGCGCQGVTTTAKSNTSSITISVSNGTYKYQVRKVTGYYVNGTAHGMFTIAGSDAGPISMSFLPVISYDVVFSETGLPNATAWTVSLTGNGTGQLKNVETQTETTVETSMDFMLPNGTYHYVVSPVPGSYFVGHSSKGKFQVAGGTPPTIVIPFTTPPTYSVTFSESGLATGTNWSVRVHESGAIPITETESSTTANITFSLPNGSFVYAIGEVLGFNVVSSVTGTLVVAGVAQSVAVTYAAVALGAFYAVAFQEVGLASGTHWAVTVTATHTFGHSRTAEQSTTGSTIYFLLQNGTYRFTVHGPIQYTLVSGGSGEFTISGSAPGVQVVDFTAKPTYTVTFNETGLPNGTNWTILVKTQYTGSSLWPVRDILRTNTSSVSVALPNGSYCYTIYGVHGYYVSSGFPAGPITVSGASPPVITVGFSPRA